MNVKRWTLKLTLFMLTGAVVTWAVAWGCAWPGLLDPKFAVQGTGEQHFFPADDKFLVVRSTKKLGCEAVTAARMDKQNADRMQFMWPTGGMSRGPAKFPPLKLSPDSAIPRWADLDHFGAVSLRSGWPAPALKMVKAVSKTGGPLQLTYIDTRGTMRGLPCTPLWRGFTLNTLLAAGLMLSLVEGGAWWRRLARRRKGRCPWCAYDRAGVEAGKACPECGGAGAGA